MRDDMLDFDSIPDCNVLRPGIYGYEEARLIFNRMIDRRPSAIMRCRTHEGAVRAAAAAQRSREPFTVRGGAHSIAGSCIQDGALCLDFSQLRTVRIDRKTKRAYVEPGALVCDLDAAAWKHGLGVTGGIISNTGVTGLSLGGGLGWLMGMYGLACDNIIEIEVVDGRGEVHRVTTDHPDLWAFRGIGRKLGVITELVLQLHELPPAVVAGRWVGNGPSGEQLQDLFGSVLSLPDWITVSPAWVWKDGRVRPIVDFVSLGGLAETRKVVRHAIGSTGRQVQAECSYPQAQQMLDSVNRFGRRNYWKSVALPALTIDLADAAERWLRCSPSRQTFISIDVLHGQALIDPPGGSAYPLRDRPFIFLFNTIWLRPTEDAPNISWVRQAYRELLRLTSVTGETYENYFGSDDSPADDPAYRNIIDRWTSRN